MTQEKKEHKAFIAQERKGRKESNRLKRVEDTKSSTAVDNKLQTGAFQKQVAHFSQNRKLRRQFSKQTGMMLPNTNTPYRKDMVLQPK